MSSQWRRHYERQRMWATLYFAAVVPLVALAVTRGAIWLVPVVVIGLNAPTMLMMLTDARRWADEEAIPNSEGSDG